MPRPRGGDWLEDEIRALKVADVDVVVSLLARHEITELDITEEQALCAANGIAYFSLPIADYSVPSSEQEFAHHVQALSRLLDEGKSIAIHCRQGIGRSSLLAACVLVLGGLSAEEAFQRIETARGCAVPDTQAQREWVNRFAERLRHKHN